jgi:rSAM/selenodomain-associated transferase 1
MTPHPSTPGVRVLVLAKAPLPGRVKTRLCPPCTPAQAARVAAAAIADTLVTVAATPVAARILVADGPLPAPPGWHRTVQQGTTLGQRLAHAFADTRREGSPSLLIGMDTPQVTVAHLRTAARLLDRCDAVLGLAEDGGWWALGLREPGHASVLVGVPTSTPDTGALTLAALHRRGLRVAMLPVLRDVDTAADARAVAALCPPGGVFAPAVAQALGVPA